jgi:Domain of unknown function (DUF397)
VDRPHSERTWHRSRYCDVGNCVEIAASTEMVTMRSSTDPDTTFTMSRDEWRAFLASAKDGHFDEL